MKNRFAKVAAVLIALALSSVAREQKFDTYTNVRFGYAVDYPADMLTPQGEPDNGDGQRFTSQTGDVELLAVGSYNALDKTLRERFAEEMEPEDDDAPKRTVTYKVLKKDWFVVSGTEGKRVFYTKVMLKEDTFKRMTFRYPAERDAELTPLTARIAKSFRHVQVETDRTGSP
ncbi:MAG TPA: hypothetical protein VK993_04000 [Chthoniobacterales bacterium]|nr:hypothetical protein [Chthoniobacterales bacterium]